MIIPPGSQSPAALYPFDLPNTPFFLSLDQVYAWRSAQGVPIPPGTSPSVLPGQGGLAPAAPPGAAPTQTSPCPPGYNQDPVTGACVPASTIPNSYNLNPFNGLPLFGPLPAGTPTSGPSTPASFDLPGAIGSAVSAAVGTPIGQGFAALGTSIDNVRKGFASAAQNVGVAILVLVIVLLLAGGGVRLILD